MITCKECDIPDEKEENVCEGCFGASFNDCFDCEKGGNKDE